MEIRSAAAKNAARSGWHVTEQEIGAGRMLDWLKSNGYTIALRGPSRTRHGGFELFAAVLPRDYAIASAVGPQPAEKENKATDDE